MEQALKPLKEKIPRVGSVNRNDLLKALQFLGVDPNVTVELLITPSEMTVTENIVDENDRLVLNEEKDDIQKRRYKKAIR